MTIRQLKNLQNYVDEKLLDTENLIDEEKRQQMNMVSQLFGTDDIEFGINLLGFENNQKEYVDDFCQTVFNKLSKYTKTDYSELIKVLTTYETGLNLYSTTIITKSMARMISKLVMMFAIESHSDSNKKVNIQIIDQFKDMFEYTNNGRRI